MSTENFFYLNIVGQLKSCRFPMGPDAGSIFCRYVQVILEDLIIVTKTKFISRFDVVVGADWEIVSGIKSGITQYASSSTSEFEEVVFNMPIECTFKSTNIYGCK